MAKARLITRCGCSRIIEMPHEHYPRDYRIPLTFETIPEYHETTYRTFVLNGVSDGIAVYVEDGK